MENYRNEQFNTKAKKHLSLIVYRDNSSRTYNSFVFSPDKEYTEQCSKLIKNDNSLRLVRSYKKVRVEVIDELADKIDKELNRGWIDFRDLDDLFLRNSVEVYQKLYKDAKD